MRWILAKRWSHPRMQINAQRKATRMTTKSPANVFSAASLAQQPPYSLFYFHQKFRSEDLTFDQNKREKKKPSNLSFVVAMKPLNQVIMLFEKPICSICLLSFSLIIALIFTRAKRTKKVRIVGKYDSLRNKIEQVVGKPNLLRICG
ncbi:uncharacterized protein [Spinacia oleracea]|uniref:Uncharacterized protein n=1 Tax=Spinacia oleracea TaxID=3562 RepID=A0ABM3R7G1_SPIOL|nr:uncharacterized protein LOC110787582 [Spinacia oleracea]